MTHEYVTAKRPALDIPAVTRELQRCGSRIPAPTFLAETPTTQQIAVDMLHAGTQPPFIVITDLQTAGRGRLDRQWVTPPRTAVLMSVALPYSATPALPLRVGTVVLEVLLRHAPTLALKWPNDIVHVDAGGIRKLGGIIAEVVPDRGAVVVGIGINVALSAAELPTPDALSLAQLGEAPARESLVAEIAQACTGIDDVDLDRYRRNCCTIGSDVRVTRVGAEPLVGRAVGVDDEGALLVEVDGAVHQVSAGDVLHVRPGEGA